MEPLKSTQRHDHGGLGLLAIRAADANGAFTDD
jgi:hypothetical protein